VRGQFLAAARGSITRRRYQTTKDDRVGPQHARKFAAKLASMGSPYLFYEVIEGGHGAGANIKERSFTTALEMTYFRQKLMN
jgi:prolyl oligopeptidase